MNHGTVITQVCQSMSRMIPTVRRENRADFVSRVWYRGNLQHLQTTLYKRSKYNLKQKKKRKKALRALKIIYFFFTDQIHIAIDDLLTNDYDAIDVDPFVKISSQLFGNLPCAVKNQRDGVPFNTDS